MKTLPLVKKPCGILAVDFDGTIHWPHHRPPVDRRFFEWVEFLRAKHHIIWGVCTGRSLMHLVEGFSQGFPFLPDFIVARERELFFPGPLGRFVPDQEWNKKCDRAHEKLFKKLRKELNAVKDYVENEAQGEWVEVQGDLAGVVLPDVAEMEGLLVEVDRVLGSHSEVSYERNDVYLRFSHSSYGKGPALKEVSRRCGLGPEQVFVAGDNFNDLSMLAPEVTSWPICPGNAVAEVKKQVAAYGGVVGESQASSGLVEAFEKIFLTEEDLKRIE